MTDKELLEIEHSKDACVEAVHMLKENAKGFPALYLDHPAYQEIIAYAQGRAEFYRRKMIDA